MAMEVQSAEDVLYFRGEISVMMHHLPAPCFAAIDIRDAKLELHLLTGEDYLDAFRSYRVGQIMPARTSRSGTVLPIRVQACNLLPRCPDLVPTALSTRGRVHRCHIRSMGDKGGLFPLPRKRRRLKKE